MRKQRAAAIDPIAEQGGQSRLPTRCNGDYPNLYRVSIRA